MTKVINIYCDESCHLEHDHQPIMLFGAVWCPREDVRQNIVALRKLKEKHHARGELKWSKVSDSRKTFFIDLVDLFFLSFNLNFRCLIVKGRWDAVKKLNDIGDVLNY